MSLAQILRAWQLGQVLSLVLPVVHPATWLGHQAKGLIGLGFEAQCRQGPGWFFGFPKWVPASAGSKYATLVDAVQ